MLKINPNPTFKAVINIPSPEGDIEIDVIYKHRTRKELSEFLNSIGTNETQTDSQVLMQIIEGWGRVDVEFSVENLQRLIDNYHGSAKSLYDGYLEALSQARIKN